jgi:putative DNA primase/helicase
MSVAGGNGVVGGTGVGLKQALIFAERWGFAVCPLFPPKDGRCACGAKNNHDGSDCRSSCKHPINKNGLSGGSKDPAAIASLFTGWPDANVGIVTGEASDLFVLDIDTKHNGHKELERLIAIHGPLPATPVVYTPSGGTHYYFRRPRGGCKNSTSQVGRGIDVRCDGGLIVAPGSRRPDGVYMPDGAGFEVPLAEVPEWLLRLARGGGKDAKEAEEARRAQTALGAGLNGHRRNDYLTSVAGKLRRVGATAEAILTQLREENAKFSDPLEEKEVRGVAASVDRNYAPSDVAIPPPSSPGEVAPGGGALSDMKMAEIFVERARARLRYCPEFNDFIGFDGRRWSLAWGAAQQALLKVIREVCREFGASQKEIVKWESASRFEAVLRAAKTIPDMVLHADELDVDPWLFNVQNGTIDLRTGVLRPHDPADLISKISPVAFDMEATCPWWDRYLLETGGTKRPWFSSYMYRVAGYCLTGSTSEQAFFFCWGDGENGKTTLVETMENILGEYAVKSQAATFMRQQFGRSGPREDLVAMRGARFISASELSSGQSFDEPFMKDITGGDRVACEPKYGKQFQFKPQLKLMMYGNDKPKISGTDRGIWRRVNLIPFLETVTAEQKGRGLKEKLVAEAPGILNWMVMGCLEWQREGLRTPQAVKNENDSYRLEMQPFERFFRRAYKSDKEHYVLNNEIFREYQSWCEDEGEEPVSKKAAVRTIVAYGGTPYRSIKGRGWNGFKPRTEEELVSYDATETASVAWGVDPAKTKTEHLQLASGSP